MSPLTVVVVSADAESGAKAVAEVQSAYGAMARSVLLSLGPYGAGWTAKANAGILVAQTKYLLIINDDVRLSGAALTEWILTMESTVAIDAMGPTIACRSHQQFNVKEPAAVDVPWLVGGCLLLKMSAVDKVGPMDPGFHSYGSDVDLCFRLAAVGYRCRWDQTYTAEHVATQTLGPSWDKDHQRLTDMWPQRLGDFRWVPEGIVSSVAEAVPMDQVEQNASVDDDLNLDHPWNIQEAAFAEIVRLGKSIDARRILEFGSGKSTVRLALAFPLAHIEAIEHNREYAQFVDNLAKKHPIPPPGIRPRGAKVLLHTVSIEDNAYNLYALDLPDASFDLVIVDGPPSTVNGGRIAALRDACRLVRVGGIIVMDDVNRPAEREAVRIQFEEWGGAFLYDQIAVGHGLGVLTRVEPDGTEKTTMPTLQAKTAASIS